MSETQSLLHVHQRGQRNSLILVIREVSDLSLKQNFGRLKGGRKEQISKAPEVVLGVMVLWSGGSSAAM